MLTAIRTCLVSIVAVCVLAVGAHAAPGDVTATVESPCKYPSGLASDGTHLYLADWREARIFQIDPADGSVLNTWPAPSLNPHGLTFGADRLWVSDDHTGGIFALDLDTGIVRRAVRARPRQGLSRHHRRRHDPRFL
jgi:sugar lactone lactonase YvrE